MQARSSPALPVNVSLARVATDWDSANDFSQPFCYD